ncbi:unnamed protein product [Meganyctiphanes norvegica]|uniref:Uncharacterized protein n=1 Tax=Meganyctiphanes norvegica TaxID=48144 RepID=A0AAV2Q3D3_MEGNR
MSSTTATQLLEWEDYLVVGLYFGFVLAVGLYTSYRSRSSGEGGSVAGYFLASRNMHWIPVGASLFASNIGSGHFIGLAGSGAASGIGIGAFELNAIYILMLLGWLFVPVYMSSGVFTMPEYLRERFGGQRIRVYLSVLTLMLYVFTKISADLFAGALFIQEAIGQTSDEWLYISIIILLAIAAIFTIAGGLTAVIWTDFVQTILMIIGALILMVMSLDAVGGYESLVEQFFYAAPNVTVYSGANNETNCGEPPSYSMNFFRSAVPGESDLPWTGMLFGVTVSSVWYWCTDQVIVQRTLSSKNMINAKGGCLLAAVIKFLPLFILVFPGMASRILYTEEVACVDREECKRYCGSTTGCTNSAYIKLVLDLLPKGLRGMMFAVMMAALMSSLTSIFNSASTIFTIDIWTRIRKKATDSELLIVGRAFVIVLVVISVIWIPVIQNSASSQLFVYIQSISSFLSPPVCAVYLLAMFWERTNEPGAFWGLMSGFVIGMVRFGLEFGWSVPPCGYEHEDTRPEIIKIIVGNIHYLHFGILLFFISLAVTIMISLLTPPIDKKHLHRLTWSTKSDTEVRVPISKKDLSEGVSNPGFEEDETAKSANGTKNLPSADKEEEEISCLRQAFNCVCGIEPSTGEVEKPPEISPEQKAKEAAEFLHQSPRGTLIVNASAITVMTLTAFLWGFYA